MKNLLNVNESKVISFGRKTKDGKIELKKKKQL